MLKIGITGNIGSGKTTVCHIFETLGVPVYYADARGKFLLQNNENVKAQIIAAFGEAIGSPGHAIDQGRLAEMVFNDPAKLKALESIIHPAVLIDFTKWHSLQKSLYIIKEAALLFEAGTYRSLDKIITVSAPLETRVKRVIARNHTTREHVLARENRQWPEDKKVEMSDFVIYNNDEQLLLPQVLELHQLFFSIKNRQ